VIVPARNEARNIGRCVRSILDSTYPRLELFVVDDHSTDGTSELARAAAVGDSRLRVLACPPLPNGWLGKQWACATGAAAASGALLLFTDADTWHGPELAARAVNAMRSTGADLLTVAGRQETHSFWERLLQPQILWILLARYGGTESVSHARRAEDVIANGQFLLFTREAYDAVGGHAAVRHKIAEDLALAQQLFRARRRVVLVRGDDQLSTHMYASLGELARGWGKNVYAGGIDAMPGGALGRLLFPVALPLIPLMGVAPWLALGAAALGVLGAGWATWSIVCIAASLVWWAVIYRGFEQPMWYALLFPVGAAVVLYIMLRAIARGRRVGWKGREYVAG
jgi:chlorobactene glucosyltransferase